MAKYHISKRTGQPTECRATKKPCPLGGEHFDSMEAAEKHLAGNQPTIKTLSKKKEPQEASASKKFTRPDGIQEWRNKNGEIHREDGPALIDTEGNQHWFLNGELHREDGPAYIGVDGTEAWYQNWEQHREDGPAITNADGSKAWFQHGRLHRADGPAVILSDGNQEWWLNDTEVTREEVLTNNDIVTETITENGTHEWRDKNGELHREDGPAIIDTEGNQHWYQHGQLHRTDGPAITRDDGTEEWYLNGVLHRDGAPAITKDDGTELWYQHGQLHRDGAPAIKEAEIADEEGYSYLQYSHHWYQNGEKHREDGPAAIYPDGKEEWYQNGQLHRDGQPAVVSVDPYTGEPKYEEWYQNGKKHRDGQPAVVSVDPYTGEPKYEEWYQNGKKHREDGPAVFSHSGNRRNEYWHHGKHYPDVESDIEWEYVKMINQK